MRGVFCYTKPMSEGIPLSPKTPSSLERRESSSVAAFQLLGNREEQQDAFAFQSLKERCHDTWRFIVADGHGPDGGTIARDVVDAMNHALSVLGHDVTTEDIRELFADAHAHIIEKKWDGGTTVTLTLLREGRLTTAWVGNSQARLARRDGGLETLAIPHEYLAHPAERVRLDHGGATVAPQGHPATRGHLLIGQQSFECTRSLGDTDLRSSFILHEPEIRQATLRDDHAFLLIGSDGFWEKLKRRRHIIEHTLGQAKNAAEANRQIKTLISNWKLDDNTTLLIVDVQK